MGKRIENLTTLRNELKKAWKRVLFIIAVLITTLLFFCSCGLTKKSLTSNTKQIEKSEVVTDTSSKETINKKIDDSASFKVAESNTGDAEFDERVNEAVSNVLRSINFQKSSGDNSYRLYYDEKLRTLEAQIQVGETRDKEVATNKEAVVEKTFEENISEYVKKIVIPWWMYVIVFIIGWKFIAPVLFFIFPQLRGLKTLKDIVTPPKPDTK